MIPLTPLEGLLEEAGWLEGEVATLVATAVTFVLAVVVLYVLGRVVVLRVVRAALGRRDLDRHAQRPLLLVTHLTIAFVALAVGFGLAGLGNFLVAMTGVAAALALAIGFATQKVIANVVAGVFIYADRPFRIGDWIEWDEYSGTVEDISLRVTRVRTFDNELLTVPNATLTGGVIKNPVDGDSLRVRFTFGIGYDDDVSAARDIILAEAERHEEILSDPAPTVRLVDLGSSDVALQAGIWIAHPSRGDVVRIRGEYVEAVKGRFDEAGIDIPYPVRTLEGGLTLEDSP